MIGKKINQLATELAPVSTDLTIIGDPDSGVSKKITLAQLGAIFSGAVSFYTDLASFPATGDINVIYCAKDTQKLYLWSGSAYVEVFPSQALLDTYQLRSEKGNANGYASLDSGGKVPISQLPSSIMEYKGTWNASTNTPTLANGTGDTGDVYICNVAGTVNFGAGPLTFAVGDYVIYSGSIWQRSSGAVGTVTSVALTVGGDAISVSGSPLTTSGTLALAFSGTSAQYINGAGNLINFPTSLVTGTGTIYSLTKWGFTSGNIINSNLFDTGSVIYNNNATAGAFAVQFNGNTTTGLSYGLLINAGTNASDIALRVQNASSTSEYFFVYGDGKVQINNIPNATIDTDRFIVSDSGVIKYRTGAELLSDIGGASASGYVPYTGATANLDLGTHTLIAAKGTFSSSGSGDTVGITHSSGSGIALNITKGGNGEGLYINKTSGSGNAATIIGTLNATTLVKSGGTSSQFLKADGSVDSTSYGTGSVTSVGLSSATSGVTIGSTPITTSGTITLAIATASGSQQGLLSSTDWTTFNNKQNALTNPVTGTGTTNYLPKFTGASTIGNSQIFDNGTNVGINNASPAERLSVAGAIMSTGAITGHGANRTTISQEGGNGAFWQSYGADASTVGTFTLRQASSDFSIVRSPLIIASTGAATFSSSVTATELYLSTSNGLVGNINSSNANGGYLTWQTSGAVIADIGTTQQIFGSGGNDTFGINGRGARAIAFGTNNTERMRITSGGMVSINTTQSLAQLNVKRSSSGATVRGLALYNNIGDSVNTGISLDFYVNNGDDDRCARIISTQSTAGLYADLQFHTSNNALPVERMRITSGGGVGIGTTSPSDLLHIGNTTTGGNLRIVSSGYGSNGLARFFGTDNAEKLQIGALGTNESYIYTPSGVSLSIYAGASERMRVTSGGNVGIGTTTPGSKLSIVGLPTSSAGLSSGDIYVLAGVLMIV
jgi:hypothetical protein